MTLSQRRDAERQIEKCRELAMQHFGFIEKVNTEFRNLGRTAGWASRERLSRYILKLNDQLLSPEYASELHETIAHEMAHLVCFAMPHLGRNHDAGWKRVCVMLGGNGERCHSLPLKRARRARKAIYQVANGETKIGLTVHKRILQGRVYTVRATGERITPEKFTGKIITV